ncbi:phytanoyl-CoA dioxygenase family protein [Thalassotalea agariperforans]
MQLTEKQFEFFQAHGYLVLKNVLNDDLLYQVDEIVDTWVSEMLLDWQKNGFYIDEMLLKLGAKKNFLELWKKAGFVNFRRRPNKYLINDAMFELMNNEVFVQLAQKLLSQKKLSMHGIFNARCQLPNDKRTETPIHQDSQYWLLDYGEGDQSEMIPNHKLVTFWFPLHDVNENNGAMQVISRTEFGNKLFDAFDYDYKNTGYFGLSPDDLSHHNLQPIPLNRGDLLVFDHLVPHGACQNISDDVRWSLDFRYELAESRPNIGEKFGFNVVDSALKSQEKAKWLAKALK